MSIGGTGLSARFCVLIFPETIINDAIRSRNLGFAHRLTILSSTRHRCIGTWVVLSIRSPIHDYRQSDLLFNLAFVTRKTIHEWKLFLAFFNKSFTSKAQVVNFKSFESVKLCNFWENLRAFAWLNCQKTKNKCQMYIKTLNMTHDWYCQA